MIAVIVPYIHTGHGHLTMKGLLACFIAFIILSLPGCIAYLIKRKKNEYMNIWIQFSIIGLFANIAIFGMVYLAIFIEGLL